MRHLGHFFGSSARAASQYGNMESPGKAAYSAGVLLGALSSASEQIFQLDLQWDSEPPGNPHCDLFPPSALVRASTNWR